MKVYIVYCAHRDSHDRLISVHSTVQAAEEVIKYLSDTHPLEVYFWTEERVQD